MGGVEEEPSAKRLKVDEVNDSGTRSNVDKAIDAVNKVDLVRVVVEALYNMGYSESAICLQNESGIKMSQLVRVFVLQVRMRKWDDSVSTLRKIGQEVGNKSVMEGNKSVMEAIYIISKQKFFEKLDGDNLMGALTTLRTEMPFGVNSDRIKDLSYYLVCPENGSRSKTPEELLEDLKKVLPPSLLFMKNRLQHIILQALDVQKSNCRFHISPVGDMSLISDHIDCKTLQILEKQILEKQTDYALQFSHDGKFLASSSTSCPFTIWKVKDNKVFRERQINGHARPITDMSWSPDDHQLLTSGIAKTDGVRLWDVASGECLQVYEKQGEWLMSCAWSDDGKSIFTGSAQNTIRQWSLEGEEMKSWVSPTNGCLAILGVYGKEIVLQYRANKILFLDWETNSERFIEEKRQIVSFTLSGKFLLVSLLKEKIHLWKIDGSPRMVGKYKGHRHMKLFAQPCFGGLEQSFIAIGSEDSQVCIWHRLSGDLIMTLGGHSGPVKCVAWNPTYPHMLASSGHDHTLRIWRMGSE